MSAVVRTPAQRGRASRSKGQRGEREVCALLSELLGRIVRRRVRNHQGDSDLVGAEPWIVEIKNYSKSSPALVRGWWTQTCRQAQADGGWPLLVYKIGRQGWRCTWPAHLHHTDSTSDLIEDTLTSDPLTWWRMTRHLTA